MALAIHKPVFYKPLINNFKINYHIFVFMLLANNHSALNQIKMNLLSLTGFALLWPVEQITGIVVGVTLFVSIWDINIWQRWQVLIKKRQTWLWLSYALAHFLILLNGNEFSKGWHELEKRAVVLAFPLIIIGSGFSPTQTDKILRGFTTGLLVYVATAVVVAVYTHHVLFPHKMPWEYLKHSSLVFYMDMPHIRLGMATIAGLLLIWYRPLTTPFGPKFRPYALLVLLAVLVLLGSKNCYGIVAIILTFELSKKIKWLAPWRRQALLLLPVVLHLVLMGFYFKLFEPQAIMQHIKPAHQIETNNSVGTRYHLGVINAQLLKKHWLTGLPTDSIKNYRQKAYLRFKFYNKNTRGVFDTHNFFIETGLLFGVGAMVAFLVMYGVLSWQAIKTHNDFLTTFLFSSLFSGLTDSFLIIIYYIFIFYFISSFFIFNTKSKTET